MHKSFSSNSFVQMKMIIHNKSLSNGVVSPHGLYGVVSGGDNSAHSHSLARPWRARRMSNNKILQGNRVHTAHISTYIYMHERIKKKFVWKKEQATAATTTTTTKMPTKDNNTHSIEKERTKFRLHENLNVQSVRFCLNSAMQHSVLCAVRCAVCMCGDDGGDGNAAWISQNRFYRNGTIWFGCLALAKLLFRPLLLLLLLSSR